MTTNAQTTAYICDVLRRLGITKLIVTFDGGGDSGQIESIEAEGITTELEKIPCDETITTSWFRVSPEGEPIEVRDHRPSKDLYDFLETWFYDNVLQEAVDFDWVNNDGGYGTITVSPQIGDIFVEAHERYTDTRSHNYEWDANSDDLIPLTPWVNSLAGPEASNG
jgi:hypothetical protein